MNESNRILSCADRRTDAGLFYPNDFMNRKLGFDLHGENDFKRWQDMILDLTGVESSVVVTSHAISIRTESYSDYLLAKSVVSKRTGMEIVRG